MGGTLRFGRGRRKRGVGRHFLYNRRRELFGLQGCFACLSNNDRVPPQTLSTVELDSPFGYENLAVYTALLIDLYVDIELAFAVNTVSSQQRAAGTKAPQLVTGSTTTRH